MYTAVHLNRAIVQDFNLIFFFIFSFLKKIRFHYVESGDRSKPLILFIHGIPDFWYSWRHQIPEFSSEYWFVENSWMIYREFLAQNSTEQL